MLTCLLCSDHEGQDLIAAQEHLMSEHGLTPKDLTALSSTWSRDMQDKSPITWFHKGKAILYSEFWGRL